MQKEDKIKLKTQLKKCVPNYANHIENYGFGCKKFNDSGEIKVQKIFLDKYKVSVNLYSSNN